jgi:hypothetical protein
MPEINFAAQMIGVSSDIAGSGTYSWRGILSSSWKDGSAQNKQRTQSFNIEKDTIGGTWKPDFQSILMGGDMNVVVSVTVDGKTYQDKVAIKIVGKNPDKEKNIKAGLADEYRVLIYKESKWRQFDKNGNPLLGPPSGYGLTQLDPVPSYVELWSWKDNLKSGIAHFDANLKKSRGLSAYVRNYYKGKEPVTDLTDDQILEQAFYFYNAGDATFVKGVWHTYYIWNTINDRWIVNNKANSNGKKYAEDSMRLYADVKNGKPPKDW